MYTKCSLYLHILRIHVPFLFVCCCVVGGGGFFGFFCFAFGALLAENEKYQHTCRLNLRGFFFSLIYSTVLQKIRCQKISIDMKMTISFQIV